MSKILRTLIVEDSEDDALLLLRELRRGGYEIEFERVDTAAAMKAALDSHSWDIILSDYAMPQFSAAQALAVVKERETDLPFLIVSGTIGEENAIAALLAGAQDFISKDHMARLIPAIERELREAEGRQAKRASEVALLESEARYRHLFDSNPLPLWVYDLETLAFLAVNDAAIQHYGYSQDEFLSMTIKDIRPAEDIPTLLSDISKTRTGLSETNVWRHHKKDGTVIDVEITAHEILFASRPARLILSNDITKRRRAEENLRRSNQRLETLHVIDRAILAAQSAETICQLGLEFIVSQIAVWGASITIFTQGAEDGIVFASYGQQEQQWPIGKRIQFSAFPEADMRLLQAGKIQVVEDVLDVPARSPGIEGMQRRGLRSYVTIPLMAGGELIGLLNLGADQPHAFALELLDMPREVADQLAIAIQQTRFRDQIQRHAAELEQRVLERTAKLHRTKDRVEGILNHSSDAIILSSFDGVIQQINPAFTTLFGYSPDDVFGQSLLTLVNPSDVDGLLNALAAVVNTGKPIRAEIVAAHQDGTRLDVDVGLAAIVKGNKIQDVVVGLRDITERKQMEQGLRAALEKEKELNELKLRFSSMVSHEFRTPLAVILSSAGLLQGYSDRMSVEKRAEHLSQIQVQVERLVGLLDDVLTLSQAETVGIEMRKEPVDLSVLCAALVVEIQQTTQQHVLMLSIDGDSRPIALDTKLIRQAITNLLTNAVKYSPAGGTVRVDLAYRAHQILIHIQDEGIGIPEPDQKRLFEVFHRAKNVGAVPGTGLGLPIVKRAVEAHGGAVSVKSVVGSGTTFIIQIPFEANTMEAS
jgi:PAS domain S-box-containing protein